MRRSVLVGVGIAIAALALTNPSLRDMKEAAPTDLDLLIGLKSPSDRWWIEDRSYVRRWNFIVCSVYTMEFHESKRGYSSPHEYTYLGVAKNIVCLTEK